MPKLTHREALVKASVQFTKEQYRRLTLLAQQEDRKIAYVVRQMVDEGLAKCPESEDDRAA